MEKATLQHSGTFGCFSLWENTSFTVFSESLRGKTFHDSQTVGRLVKLGL